MVTVERDIGIIIVRHGIMFPFLDYLILCVWLHTYLFPIPDQYL